VRKDYYLERSGDLEEAYADMLEESSPFRAKVWLWLQILKLFYGIIRTCIVWRCIGDKKKCLDVRGRHKS
jgi:hypothetical protein